MRRSSDIIDPAQHNQRASYDETTLLWLKCHCRGERAGPVRVEQCGTNSTAAVEGYR